MAITTTDTTSNQQLTEKDVSAFADAKRKLAARSAQLAALRARAVKAGNKALVAKLDADIKEAASLRARVATVDAMLDPFLRAWEWAKKTIGLGDLGLVWVPFAVAGAIAAVVYAINVFDRKVETSSDRYEAELKAAEEWKAKGLTTEQAVSQVNKTGAQISDEKKDGGLFGDVRDMVKLGGVVLLLGGAWWLYNNGKKGSGRAAAA